MLVRNMLALLIPSLLLLLVLLVDERLYHWMSIGVLICGVIVWWQLIKCVQERFNLIDPRLIISILFVHLFFLAPTLHVYLDIYMRYVVEPNDWRYWIGFMAFLNAVGLLLYGRNAFSNYKIHLKTFWVARERRLLFFAIILMMGSILSQGFIYYYFGGISGYIDEYSASLDGWSDSKFKGMGLLFVFAECGPGILVILFCVFSRKKLLLRSKLMFFLYIAGIFSAQLIMGGLRGSRSNTIWVMFWAIGSYHLMVRKISKVQFAALFVSLVLFMYIYGFYKAERKHFQFSDVGYYREIGVDSDRSFGNLILWDLGRYDIQAYLLFKDISGHLKYSFGRSYIGDLSIIIPRAIWENRIDTKVRESTIALHGNEVYLAGMRSAKVLGLLGEGIVNFGFLSIPLLFYLYGKLCAFLRSLLMATNNDDFRMVLVPIFINLLIIVFTADFDNVIFFIGNKVIIPTLLVFYCSKKLNTT